MKTSKLQQLKEQLKNKTKSRKKLHYTVPDLWNCFGYKGKDAVYREDGQIEVHPYKFYHAAIEHVLADGGFDPAIDYSKSVTQIHGNNDQQQWGYMGGDWIKKSSVYSMHVRTSTSWDHNESGELETVNEYGFKETGTFVKSIALLPLLKRMGITAIYLLPISEYSDNFKKGGMGSPYAVKNFFKLDPNLKDSMTEPDFSVEDEFAAFVEACHVLNMRVLIDIIPRTASRDSSLMLHHPDWFYWIHQDSIEHYRPPFVHGVAPADKPTFENLHMIYYSGEVWDHMRKFVDSPDKQDPKKWKSIQERCIADPSLEVFELIQESFGITTAPAFSDGVNDPQPAWSDITFLRLYLDHPLASQHYIGHNDIKPYILFDVIKANMFKGAIRNEELWQTLSGVIPYYQEQFGIDGARIDMGHALPEELVQLIIDRPRQIDSDFSLIAEEVQVKNGWAARNAGYNMILGDGYFAEPRMFEFKTHEFMYEGFTYGAPVFACGETPDTPRLAARHGGQTLSKFLAVMNHFMPNGVPFTNSGLELFETQPMNTGIDCAPDEQWRLNPEDPYNGKLAFFEKYQLHWTNPDRWVLPNIIEQVSAIRRRHIFAVTDLGNNFPLHFDNWRSPAIGFAFIVENRRWKTHDNLLIVVGNTDLSHSQTFTVNLGHVRHESGNTSRRAWIEYSLYSGQYESFDFDEHWNLRLSLKPGEVVIAYI
jgi:starch synthase (maltosyl-transferring)